MKKKIKESNFRMRSRSERIALNAITIFFSIWGATLIFPFVWGFINSLKTVREFNESQFSLPAVMQWENYIKALSVEVDHVPLLETVWNSIWLTFASIPFGIFFGSLAPYIIAKYKFRLNGFFFGLVILMSTLPLMGGTAATYELLTQTFPIANNPFLWWITWTGSLSGSFLIRYAAFKNVSWNYAEAAFIDGASHFSVFIRIMLPLIKPLLTAQVIMSCVSCWHDYMTSYMYMTDYPTLGLAIYMLSSDASRIGVPIYLSLVLVSCVPSIGIFCIFQDHIMKNMTMGGLKG